MFETLIQYKYVILPVYEICMKAHCRDKDDRTMISYLIKHIYIESGPLKFYSNIPVANELNNFLVIIKNVFLDY